MSRSARIVLLIAVVLTGFVAGNGAAEDPTPSAKATSSVQPAEGTIGPQSEKTPPSGQVADASLIDQSSNEVATRVAIVSGVPADHMISEAGSPIANDLSHGDGLSLMTVRRTWLGRGTVNTHFGVGWSDPNHVRLTLLSADRLLIWRGGTGWRTAQREGDQFATGDGDTIRTTPEGWRMRFVSGEEWSFHSDGALASIQSAWGAVRKFAYETGRLTAIEVAPDNRLLYHYDAKHKRVSHIDGPEGLSLKYDYDAQGRLSRVTTARAIAIDYRYDGKGQLVVARDQFGTQLLLTPSGDDSAQPPATPSSVAPSATVKADTSQPGATENRSTAQAPRPQAPAASPPPSLLLLSRPKFKFDQRGLVTEQEDDGWTTHYSYDEAGRVSAAAGLQGRVSFTYDSFGRTTSVTLPDGRTSSTQYNSLGLPVLIVLPDGHDIAVVTDAAQRPTRISIGPALNIDVTYDRADCIVQIVARGLALDPVFTERAADVSPPSSYRVTRRVAQIVRVGACRGGEKRLRLAHGTSNPSEPLVPLAHSSRKSQLCHPASIYLYSTRDRGIMAVV